MILRLVWLAAIWAVFGGCASVKKQVHSAPRVAVVSALPTLVLPRAVFGDAPLPSGWNVLRPNFPSSGSAAKVVDRRFLDINLAMTECIRSALNRDAKVVNARDCEAVFFGKDFTFLGNRKENLAAIEAELVRLGQEWNTDCIVLIQDGAREAVTSDKGDFRGSLSAPLVHKKSGLWVLMEVQFTVFDCKSRKFLMREILIASRPLRERPEVESSDGLAGKLDVFYRRVMTAALVEVGLSNEKNPFNLQPRGGGSTTTPPHRPVLNHYQPYNGGTYSAPGGLR